MIFVNINMVWFNRNVHLKEESVEERKDGPKIKVLDHDLFKSFSSASLLCID